MKWFIIISYFSLLALGAAAGLLRWRRLPVSLRLVWAVIALTLVSESIVFGVRFSTQTTWYAAHHIFNPVEATLITTLFLTRSNRLPSRLILAIVAGLWAAVAILNAVYFQPLAVTNSNVSLLESFVVVIMSLVSLYRIAVSRATERLIVNPLFWFWSLALLFWGSTYFYWAFHTLPEARQMAFFQVVRHTHSFMNLALYAGVAALLFFVPRLRPQTLPAQ